jgi:predicted NBD/HSP70 family sugar kinase
LLGSIFFRARSSWALSETVRHSEEEQDHVYRSRRSRARWRSNAEAAFETARHLGVGVSNLIIRFSPEAVVVGGEIARAWRLIESALTETIRKSVRRGLPSAGILPSTLGERPTLRGALSLVLASKFAAAFAD